MTRTHRSARNIVYSLILSVATMLFGFIAQRVFLHTLGTEYLGINGLFTNIVSMLGLVELGLGSAMYYHMYKPVTNGDTTMVKSLVNFYKKGYQLIAVAVSLLGMLTLPFLGTIVGDVSVPLNIYLIYLLFLADIVFSYLLVYKRAVLYVDQNSHIISAVHIAYTILLNSLQIAILIATQNYYLYLIIKVVMRLLENIALTYITNRKYPYLLEKSVVPLDKNIRTDIYKKVRGLSYHKVATFVVLGTDSIIISMFFGITTVGLYSNYFLVISAILMIMGQVFLGITASVGNLLATAKSSKSYEVYKKIRFGNFWLSCLAATALLVMMDSFITLWVGEKYILPTGVLVALTINLFSNLIRSPFNSFKEAAGIFHQDRFVPVLESIANIVFSLALLHYFGLAGVFLGTACSTLILHFFSYPKFVYKPLFAQTYGSYYKDFIKSVVIAVLVVGLTFVASRSLTLESNVAAFSVNVLLSLTIPNIILYLIFRNSPEFTFYTSLLKNAVSQDKKRLF